eukprot:3629638-Alexandrium_andersonii.AAC.1
MRPPLPSIQGNGVVLVCVGLALRRCRAADRDLLSPEHREAKPTEAGVSVDIAEFTHTVADVTCLECRAAHRDLLSPVHREATLTEAGVSVDIAEFTHIVADVTCVELRAALQGLVSDARVAASSSEGLAGCKERYLAAAFSKGGSPRQAAAAEE